MTRSKQRAAFLFVLTILTSTSRADDPKTPLDVAAVATAKFLAFGFSEFKRDVYVYHWGERKNIIGEDKKTVPFDDPKTAEYAERKMRWTYRKDHPGDGNNMGTALYASTDPYSTYTDYGGPNGALVEIRIPKRTRYLDLRSANYLPKELTDKLQSAGCGGIWNLTQLFRSENASPCHQIAARMLEILNISAVAYQYDNYRLDGCPNVPAMAFILVNPTLGQPEYVRTYVPGVNPPSDSGEMDRQRIQDTISKAPAGGLKFWPTLGKGPNDVTPWMQEHLFGCDLAKHPEDRIPDPAKTKPLPAFDFAATDPDWDNHPPLSTLESCPVEIPEFTIQIEDHAKKIQTILDEALKEAAAARTTGTHHPTHPVVHHPTSGSPGGSTK